MKMVTIGEAAKQSGVSMKMIRHYESIGLLDEPVRTAAGYRLYAEQNVHVLRFIHRARSLGFSLDEIKELVSLWQDQKRSSSVVKKIANAHIAQLNQKIAELVSIRDTLTDLTAHCHGDSRPDCPILDSLASDERSTHHCHS